MSYVQLYGQLLSGIKCTAAVTMGYIKVQNNKNNRLVKNVLDKSLRAQVSPTQYNCKRHEGSFVEFLDS